ncbi:two-component response regulator-like PRR95 isoform X2 [Magnolia sinica]|uniref:two-component response regulator-like PRR95 isoform X2 n=1 Tax=Magnolia sinica TaxID=86752 RepID=UPI0026583A5F|nr:two-component response regulator-like PRR95 isoform X2 [Magnolia sinica]
MGLMGDVSLSCDLDGEVTDTNKDPSLVGWESFVPRMLLRVLLVEGDDSTRQIISALLRRCSYKVAAVSDGLKAWAILKEKPHNIDLILTEVELPSITGFGLLTMIMEHGTCKNIPVIMMSSQDSISLVFKCMLRGAADFLVKPIRKNELRNLWQHVWRRQASSAVRHAPQDGNLAERKLDAISGNNAASNHSSEYVACVQKDWECSEKGSDTQDPWQLKCKSASTVIDRKAQKHKNHESWAGESEDEVKLAEATPGDQALNSNSNVLEEKCDCARVMTSDEAATACHREDANIVIETDAYNNRLVEPSREAIDLIGAIDNQQQCSHRYIDHTSIHCGALVDAEKLPDERDCISKFSLPLLELSLRRSQLSSCENREIEERHTLHHSNSSAFSRYNNRTVQPPPLPSTSLSTESRDCTSGPHKPLPSQGHDNASDAPQWNVVSQNNNQEDANSLIILPPGQDKMAFPCPRIGVIPAPIPIRGTAHNGLHACYDALMPHLFYSQSGAPVQDKNLTSQQDATHENLSRPSNPDNSNSELNFSHQHDQSADRPINQAVPEQEQNFESKKDPACITSAMGESGSSSLCNGSFSHLNSSGCGSVCDGNNRNVTAASAVGATAESGNVVELIPRDRMRVVDYQPPPSQREVALTKFRLKRKDRCYGKKVRYQSRKRLAEQRPRVKGQFVRQVHSDPRHPSVETDGYRCDSMAA